MALIRRRPVAVYVLLISAWAAAWFVAFPNIYGWFTDDWTVLFHLTDSSLRQLIDPAFFHAYVWLIAGPVMALHLRVPSQPIPLLLGHTELFRALIAYTIVLHVILLAAVAAFVRTVLDDERTALVAFLFFLASPTLTFYTPLLDSRYLGLLAWVPAMIVLLRAANETPVSSRIIPKAALGGVLLSLGQDIHYTTAYLGLPFALSYWLWLGIKARCDRHWLAGILSFLAGAIAYWALIELVHHSVMGFVDDPIVRLFQQREAHASHQTVANDALSFWRMFRLEMGLPMMAAVFAGFVLTLASFRSRSAAHFNLAVIASAALIGTVVLVLSPTLPFYRQFSGLQLLFAILAAVALERVWRRLEPPALPILASIALLAYLPATRSLEVYTAHQGLGHAVHVAAGYAAPSHIWYAMENNYPVRFGLSNFGTAGSRIRALHDDEIVVTHFPVLAHDPYMLAVLSATSPLATYPTLWCTQEQYAENEVYFSFERFQDEPERCQARVYSVKSLKATMGLRTIGPVTVRADSAHDASFGPENALSPQRPLWVSTASTARLHYIEVGFPGAVAVGSFAIVSPEPNYGGGRIDELSVSSSPNASGPLAPTWHAVGLAAHPAFRGSWPEAKVRRVRFTIEVQNGQRHPLYGGIKQLIFPGMRLRIPDSQPTLDFVGGFWGPEASSEHGWQWSGAQSTLSAVNNSARTRQIDVRFTLRRPGASGYVDVRSPHGNRRYVLAARPHVRVLLTLEPFGHADLLLSTNEKRLITSNGDPRDLRFQVEDATVSFYEDKPRSRRALGPTR